MEINKWNTFYYYYQLWYVLCGPQEPFEEQRETTKVDSSYYFRNMAELELETQQVVEESIACDYGKQFICPNCGEPFDGHECENCKYTEERWKDSSLYLKECYYG